MSIISTRVITSGLPSLLMSVGIMQLTAFVPNAVQKQTTAMEMTAYALSAVLKNTKTQFILITVPQTGTAFIFIPGMMANINISEASPEHR